MDLLNGCIACLIVFWAEKENVPLWRRSNGSFDLSRVILENWNKPFTLLKDILTIFSDLFFVSWLCWYCVAVILLSNCTSKNHNWINKSRCNWVFNNEFRNNIANHLFIYKVLLMIFAYTEIKAFFNFWSKKSSRIRRIS